MFQNRYLLNMINVTLVHAVLTRTVTKGYAYVGLPTSAIHTLAADRNVHTILIAQHI